MKTVSTLESSKSKHPGAATGAVETIKLQTMALLFLFHIPSVTRRLACLPYAHCFRWSLLDAHGERRRKRLCSVLL